MDGEFSFFEGEILNETEHIAASAAMEGFRAVAGDEGSLYIPLCRNRRAPFGLICLTFREEAPVENLLQHPKAMFTRHLAVLGRSAKLSPGLLGEPTVYIPCGKEPIELNSACQDFRTYFNLSDQWMEEFLGNGPLNMGDVLGERLCQGVDMESDGFSFLIVACPVPLGENYAGTLLMLSDTTEVRDMQQEVINKSTVIREIHHRVKNNLQTIASLLRLQSRRSANGLVEKALLESINRISSIALIHEALSKEGKNTVNIKDCVKSIMSMVLANMLEPGKSIKGELTGQDIFLNSSQASSVSLCITELLQNAVEHAFVIRKKGNILVAIDQIGGEVIITIEDDGVGFQGRKAKGNSLGLQIIDMITTENLKGSFRLEGHTYGSKAEIRFPL